MECGGRKGQKEKNQNVNDMTSKIIANKFIAKIQKSSSSLTFFWPLNLSLN
jgi:hypothetical protein